MEAPVPETASANTAQIDYWNAVAGPLSPGGRITFVCWRQFMETPWMTLPAAAAAAHLPPMAPPDPTAPGPFAFADADRVRAILTEAGFGSIMIEAFDTRIGGSNLDGTVELAFKVGPSCPSLPERAQT